MPGALARDTPGAPAAWRAIAPAPCFFTWAACCASNRAPRPPRGWTPGSWATSTTTCWRASTRTRGRRSDRPGSAAGRPAAGGGADPGRRAPREEGFRATAWWEQTRREIVENVRDSLQALNQLRGEYVPYAYEQAFGIKGQPRAGDRGPIRRAATRCACAALSTAWTARPTGACGSSTTRPAARGALPRAPLRRAKSSSLRSMPLPPRGAGAGRGDGRLLLARAARGLAPGERAQAERGSRWPSWGAEETIQTALEYSWETVRGVRAGQFAPKPPDDGCPDYCPAAAFCWHYAPRGETYWSLRRVVKPDLIDRQVQIARVGQSIADRRCMVRTI